jgi:hypothetical protein
LGGVGVFYPFWYATSLKPKTGHVPSSRVIDPEYTLNSSLVNVFKIEGRWGDFSFDISFLRDFLGEKIEQSGGKVASEAFDYLAGQIGWDQLFFYHDVRIEGAYSRLTGYYRDKSGNDADTAFSSNYAHFHVTLLNAMRLRYGIFYDSYDFHVPIYAHRAEAGQTTYSFADAFGADVRFHDIGVTIGYSRLDYAAKYENAVFDWYLDGDIGIGVSIADLAQSHSVAGQSVGTVVTFMVPVNLELGLLAYKRFYG